MRRALALIIVFLVLGAAINVAVAWGCALWSPNPPRCWTTAQGGVPPPFDETVPRSWLEKDLIVPFEHVRCPGRGVTMDQLRVARAEVRDLPPPDVRIDDGHGGGRIADVWERTLPTPGRFDEQLLHACEAGWPARSLWCGTVPDPTPLSQGGPTYKPRWRWCVKPPAWLGAADWEARAAHGTPHPLPMRPLWAGFAIDAGVYGAACWGLLWAGRRVRGVVRRRGGLCAACGYPVEGLERCPECGVGVGFGRGCVGE